MGEQIAIAETKTEEEARVGRKRKKRRKSTLEEIVESKEEDKERVPRLKVMVLSKQINLNVRPSKAEFKHEKLIELPRLVVKEGKKNIQIRIKKAIPVLKRPESNFEPLRFKIRVFVKHKFIGVNVRDSLPGREDNLIPQNLVDVAKEFPLKVGGLRSIKIKAKPISREEVKRMVEEAKEEFIASIYGEGSESELSTTGSPEDPSEEFFSALGGISSSPEGGKVIITDNKSLPFVLHLLKMHYIHRSKNGEFPNIMIRDLNIDSFNSVNIESDNSSNDKDNNDVRLKDLQTVFQDFNIDSSIECIIFPHSFKEEKIKKIIDLILPELRKAPEVRLGYVVLSLSEKISPFGRPEWNQIPEGLSNENIIYKTIYLPETIVPTLPEKTAHKKVASVEHILDLLENKFSPVVKRDVNDRVQYRYKIASVAAILLERGIELPKEEKEMLKEIKEHFEFEVEKGEAKIDLVYKNGQEEEYYEIETLRGTEHPLKKIDETIERLNNQLKVPLTIVIDAESAIIYKKGLLFRKRNSKAIYERVYSSQLSFKVLCLREETKPYFELLELGQFYEEFKNACITGGKEAAAKAIFGILRPKT